MVDFPLAEVVYVVCAFVLGTAVGSFLNVVIGRLPLEKSLLWPNSRCLTCLRPLGLGDNLPILGWLRLRGWCRYCRTPFSSRYLWVELATGLGFALLFYLDVLHNWHKLPFMEAGRSEISARGLPPWQALIFFLHHAVLFAFLLAAAMCDWDHRAIPLSLTVTGTLVGLVSATLFAWPFPQDPRVAVPLQTPVVAGVVVPPATWAYLPDIQDVPGGPPKKQEIPLGLYPWPVWGPVPKWLFEHRWALGLFTGLAGAAAGMVLIRTVKFLFDKGLGKEALGLGDADLMMMAGAFLGWQPVVVAFFVGAMVSIPLGLVFRLVKKEQAFPFGPGLALGVFITWMWWPWLGRGLRVFFFDEVIVLLAVGLMAGLMFVGSIGLRLMGFGSDGEPGAK
jgi:leader peptidase (prepilin peptidase)/N-methyltransferase